MEIYFYKFRGELNSIPGELNHMGKGFPYDHDNMHLTFYRLNSTYRH